MVTACALAAALLVAGCGGGSDESTASSGEVFLQPAADQGPDPFTDSTATAPAVASPLARTPQPAQSARTGPQLLSGETPGLYGGTRGAGSCDIRRQVDALASDRARGRVFAQSAGVSQASIPGYLRGLTSVVLRADTRVTNHGFRDGMGTGYQSVLQAGTAVLVDNHGVPRVRCACGNPLAPPVGTQAQAGVRGRAWSGYRPARVVVVAPATQVINDITIINVVDNTWIERPVGHRGHDHDHVVPPAKPVPPPRVPHPHDSPSGDLPGQDSATPTHESAPPSGESASPSGEGTSPSGESASPQKPPADCVTPHVTVTPGATDDMRARAPSDPRSTDCPTATATAPPPQTSPGSSQEVGPEAVPDSPDAPDGDGLIPDDPGATDSIFGSPTDVFDG
ncbi:hypothetical protein EAO75_31890 [Streptomyces sp. uw30]|nr:hypothetical protein EAO75_31890 [Streptomyces sp. uw30]